MLVDLGRNDLGRVCEYGSVEVDELMAVENYSHVMHIVSSVSGTPARGRQARWTRCARCCRRARSPGAPKVRAMQIIDELEPVKRGGYGGAIGYLCYAGDLDTCIHIRTVVVKDGEAHVQAGGGTVADAQARLRVRGVGRQGPSGDASASSWPAQANRIGRERMRVLVIDNYDSFTYNLVQYLGELGAGDRSRPQRPATVDELLAGGYDRVVVSPGPCTPDEAGIIARVVRRFPEAGIPTLGVCLGHQAIAQAFGGRVVRGEPVHGKTDVIEHDGRASSRPSLAADGRPLPLAGGRSRRPRRARRGGHRRRRIVMGVRHRELPVEGVQFHPESVLTEAGHAMLANFLADGFGMRKAAGE